MLSKKETKNDTGKMKQVSLVLTTSRMGCEPASSLPVSRPEGTFGLCSLLPSRVGMRFCLSKSHRKEGLPNIKEWWASDQNKIKQKGRSWRDGSVAPPVGGVLDHTICAYAYTCEHTHKLIKIGRAHV